MIDSIRTPFSKQCLQRDRLPSPVFIQYGEYPRSQPNSKIESDVSALRKCLGWTGKYQLVPQNARQHLTFLVTRLLICGLEWLFGREVGTSSSLLLS